MKLVFKNGERGLICRYPPDEGAWIAPGRNDRHTISPIADRVLRVEITGTSGNGRLRFCRVLEDVTSMQEATLKEIEKAVASAKNFGELRGKRWGNLGLSSFIDPWSYGSGNQGCIDDNGYPAIRSFDLNGVWLNGDAKDAGVFTPQVKPLRPVPLGEIEEAQHVMATGIVAFAIGYTDRQVPEWASDCICKIAKLIEAVKHLEQRTRKKWHAVPEGVPSFPDKYWPVAFWLLDEARRLEAFELRGLIERIEIPLESVEAELAEYLPAMPTHVRFNDDKEWEIAWSGTTGQVWVRKADFQSLVLDPTDERIAAIQAAGNSLSLVTSWEIREELEGYSAGQADEIVGRGNDSRKLI